MTRWNIFARYYSGKENHWTESLVKFFANSSPLVMNALLRELGLKQRVRNLREVSCEMQVTERVGSNRTIPDARIGGSACGPAVYFEAKVDRYFDEKQARNHINAIGRTAGGCERTLVLVTGAPAETEQFRRFIARMGRTSVKVKFLSWHAIADLLERLDKKSLDGRMQFLVEQYVDFIKKEVESMAPWQGFSKTFASKWNAKLLVWDETDKLVSELADMVDKKIESRRNWPVAKRRGKGHRREQVFQSWRLWSRYKHHVDVFVGLFGEAADEEQFVFVSWWWPDGPKGHLSGAKFERVRAKLLKRGFVLDDDLYNTEKTLDVSKLVRLSRERQVQTLRTFVAGAIDGFVTSGLDALLKG